MPPLRDILDALTYAVLPSAVAAGLVFVVVAKLLPSRLAVAAGALALAAGFLAGNHFRGAADFRLDPERFLTPSDFGRAVFNSFVPPKDEESPIPPPARYWLPWTAGLALLGGLVARAGRPAVGWLIRVVLAGLAAAFAIPTEVRSAAPWLALLLAATILAEWVVMERFGQDSDLVRLRLLPPVAASAIFLAASVVLLYAHSAKFVDLATFLSASLAAIAAAAWLLQSDPSAAAPGVAVALPGLMIAGQQDTFSEVPTVTFVLIAVTPLALMPLLLPRLRRKRLTAWAVGAALLLLPLTAVVLAATNESLSFE